MAEKFDRAQLEDKYYQLKDENIEFKKKFQKQKDAIKKLQTKLLRIENDKKRDYDDDLGRKCDVDLEQIIQDLQDQNRELKKQNRQVKEKLVATKQQLATCSKRPSPYGHIPSRVDSGKNKNQYLSNNRDHRKYGASSPLPKYGLSLLEEARSENRALEEIIQTLREQVCVLEQQNESLQEQCKLKDTEHNEEISILKSQLTAAQKKSIQNNVELIKYQRELKQKDSSLGTIDEERQGLHQKLDILKSTNQDLVADIESLNSKLKLTQSKTAKFDSLQKDKFVLERTLKQSQDEFNVLKEENNVLKEANEHLQKNSLEASLNQDNNAVEETLRSQIKKLQDIIKSQTFNFQPAEKQIQIPYSSEEKVEEDNVEYKQLEKQNDDLTEKMKFLEMDNEEMRDKLKILSDSSVVSISEFEQALSIVKTEQKPSQQLDSEGSLKKQVQMLEHQNVETTNELEKTRNMLILQHRINRDFQKEIESVNELKNQIQSELETKCQEYAKLLDMRGARIKKLENQMKDIAYGTKQYQFLDEFLEIEKESIKLERGQNLFELHIDKITLTSEALHLLQDNKPSIFLTWAFYDYQLVTTSVVKGCRPEFSHTSQYVIRADDAFLEYLMKVPIKIEVHSSTGVDYNTFGVCKLSLKPLLDDTQSRYHGKAQILGSNPNENLVIGTIEYWSRLQIPIEQAVRLFKERGKALGYINHNQTTAKSALEILEKPGKSSESNENENELHIKVIRCTGLKTGKENHQPSPYCIYSFHSSCDHDTSIIPSTNDPEFNHHNIIQVIMDHRLDEFLRTKYLQVYVFDDSENNSSSYFGVANIPLVSLINNKAINGSFEILSENGQPCGIIEINMYFQYTYLKTSTYPPFSIPSVKIDSESDTSSPMKEIVSLSNTVAKNSSDSLNVAEKIPLSETIISGDKNLSIPVPQPRNRKGSFVVSTPTDEKKDAKKPSTSKSLRFSNDVESSETVQSKPEAAPRRSSLKMMEDTSEKTEEIFHIDELSAIKKDETEDDDDSLQLSNINEYVESIDDELDNLEKAEECEKESKVSDLKQVTIMKNTPISTEDSDNVVVNSNDAKDESKMNEESIVIIIHNLTSNGNFSDIDNENLQMLFIEYKFLDYPPEELETPFALPKPSADQKSRYEFHKVFHVDAETNYSRRQMLAAMLLPKSFDLIKFIIVSEPPDDMSDDADCEDIGIATISLKKILENGDIKETDIPVMNMEGKSQIFNLNVTIEAASILKLIKSEIKKSGS